MLHAGITHNLVANHLYRNDRLPKGASGRPLDAGPCPVRAHARGTVRHGTAADASSARASSRARCGLSLGCADELTCFREILIGTNVDKMLCVGAARRAVHVARIRACAMHVHALALAARRPSWARAV